MDIPALLDGLTDAQVDAVTSDGAPLCILAGAGSGKTRVLTRRIAHRVATDSADPRHVLALTFTRKAAGELTSRLGALGVRDTVAAGTFHGVAFAQLRRRWADAGRPAPTLLERKARILGPLLGRAEGVQPGDVANEIEWAKARMIDPAGYEAAARAEGRQPPLPPAELAAVYERYEEEKRRRGLIDFDDILLQCAAALDTDEGFAQSQRWQHRHLFVDEFQDVNPVQHHLLEGWRGRSSDLCVVGDPNQAIYAWNGADPRHLTNFAAAHPGATVVHLTDSFRSSPQVLAVAAAVLTGATGRATGLRAHRPDGPIPTVRSHPTDGDEARAIARSLRDRRRPGTSWSHLAVLTRTHAQLALLEDALRDAGIPFRVRGGGALLRRPEVQAALGHLRDGRGPLHARIADLDLQVRAATPDDVEDGPAAERRAALAEIVRLGREYLALDRAGSPEGFAAWLSATVGVEAARRGEAVELATFHAAKGLEWPIVFLAGLEQGLVPIGGAGDADLDEERRLLYVAITRAELELHCSWARQRTFGTRTVPRRPSPWLEEIEAARAALAAGATGAESDWRDRIIEERRRLRSARALSGHPRGPAVTVGLGADPEILAALRAWRADAARTSGVPAPVILHDTTLAAVAEARPRDHEALMSLPGLGPVKAHRYGDAILGVVAAAGDSRSDTAAAS
ncbi:MAG TPA: ATP-dependent DNA helicase UvrD2 [Acidimicrobiales bacterium]|nr:ATP-dependent DNA helicase UvrD2 [Acidimicrobiales bacterium]